LYRKSMRVLSESATSERAELVLGVQFDGSDAGYPFLVDANITSAGWTPLVLGSPPGMEVDVLTSASAEDSLGRFQH